MNANAELRSMANEPQNRTLFTFLSERRENNKPITVDKILTATRHKIQRTDVVHFAKSLDRLNLCNFVAGRRNFPSRIMFYFTPASIGRVALGLSDNLERMSQSITAEIAGQIVKEASTAPAAPRVPLEQASNPEGPFPFQVQNSALGTLFILPSTATAEDRDALVRYIQQMPLKRSA